jgi:hypothetical protein
MLVVERLLLLWDDFDDLVGAARHLAGKAWLKLRADTHLPAARRRVARIRPAPRPT